MSKEILHGLIDMIPESDTETIYNVLLKFIPSDMPTNDELLALKAYANGAPEYQPSISQEDLLKELGL